MVAVARMTEAESKDFQPRDHFDEDNAVLAVVSHTEGGEGPYCSYTLHLEDREGDAMRLSWNDGCWELDTKGYTYVVIDECMIANMQDANVIARRLAKAEFARA